MSMLRIQESFEPFPAQQFSSINHAGSSPPIPSSARPQKKQNLTLSQTYALALLARSKLGKEAARPDHNLHLLVGSANLLDFLILELQGAEREQEAWFNHSVARAQKAEKHHTGHVPWINILVEEQEDDVDDDDSDSSDGEYNEEDEDEERYDDDVDPHSRALHRNASHPPDFIHDSDSDDDSLPTSPRRPSLAYSKEQSFDLALLKQKRVADSFHDDYYIPERENLLLETY